MAGATETTEDEDDEVVYQPPAIAWEEPYEPVGFGISCTQQEGNPGCLPGPLFT